MKNCTNCGAKLGEFYEICPFCFTNLVHGSEDEEKAKKRKKAKKLRLISIVISYSLLIGCTISWIIISVECFQSNNRICYTITLILMMLCWIFACVAPVLLGEEISTEEK